MDKFVVVCDNIRSLHNVGSIFRTSDACGVDRIFLCGVTGRPDEPLLCNKISKVSLGAEKTVPWEYKNQTWRLIDTLKKDGYNIVSLELSEKAVNYYDFKPSFPLALVIGNEVKGISKKNLNKSDYIIQIPMLGDKESLNVSVAFGVASSWIAKFK